jgi:hypothetical protein
LQQGELEVAIKARQRDETPALESWRLHCRNGLHTKTVRLWLYPELDCSACLDDVRDESGAAQLDYYCDYVRRRRPEWWAADAVPVYWSVMGNEDAFGSAGSV